MIPLMLLELLFYHDARVRCTRNRQFCSWVCVYLIVISKTYATFFSGNTIFVAPFSHSHNKLIKQKFITVPVDVFLLPPLYSYVVKYKRNKKTKKFFSISKEKHQRKQQKTEKNEMVGNNGNKGTSSVVYVIDSMNNLIQ